MKKRLLTFCVMMVCMSVVALAQAHRDIIKYINENKLYRNGNTVTVTNFDLEWPVALDGDGMLELQKELCKSLFDIDATSMQDGWTRFHEALGTRLTHMPDSVSRHHLNMKLQELWRQDGRYISFYLKRQETDSEGKELSAVKKFFTYDLLNDEVLSLDRTFTEYTDEYNRMAFESLIDQNSVCDDDDKPDIDLTVLPKDFALMGGAVILGLGGPYDHDNFSSISANNLYQLGMLKRGFVRWLEGKTKAKKKDKSVISPTDFDTSLSEDSVSYRFNEIPSFPGGNDSLASFLRKNIKYPETEMALHNQGRVVLSFIVEKDGSISDITVADPLSPGLDREAVRVVRLMPRWKPAESNGVKVRTYMRLPVTYRLSSGIE